MVPDDGRPSVEEIARRIHENLAIVAATMAPEHLAHVFDELERYPGLPVDEMSPLTREVVQMVRWHSGTGWPSVPDSPLTMPPAAAQVWLEEAEVKAIDHCNACHYPLPARSYFGHGAQGIRPAVSYFTSCPVCGSDDLRRIEDSKGVFWNGADGHYYRAGRRIDANERTSR